MANVLDEKRPIITDSSGQRVKRFKKQKEKQSDSDASRNKASDKLNLQNEEADDLDISDDCAESNYYSVLVSMISNKNNIDDNDRLKSKDTPRYACNKPVTSPEDLVQSENNHYETKIDDVNDGKIIRDEGEEDSIGSSDIEEDTDNVDTDENDSNNKKRDIYYQHFHTDLEENVVSDLDKRENWCSSNVELPSLGHGSRLECQNKCKRIPNLKQSNISGEKLLKRQLKEKLFEKAVNVNKALSKPENKKQFFSAFQRELIDYIFGYKDILYPHRSYLNGEEIRILYCLHILNHSLKLRSLVRHHNAKIVHDSDKEFRDQSLIRPKVLVLLPFRSAALKVVTMLMHLLPDRQFIVSGKKRFMEEFGQDEEIVRKSKKPADYEHLFAGNTDDCFRFGISFTKKAMKLYSDFYTSDIIIASPLGLRTVIGVEGDAEREYDFLHSIEILVLDQADALQMQNWEHVGVIMSHLHLQPRGAHGADFSRCRLWNLNGWARYYRHTLIFSDVLTPEILALYNNHCTNYAGGLVIDNLVEAGSISRVLTPLPHVFHKVDCASHERAADARFTYFTTEILPRYMDQNAPAPLKHILVFVPSYFDYVKIRNYLKRKEVKFSAISETVSEANVSRARNSFHKGDRALLLYTERYHYFRRTSFARVSHAVFYQLPHYPAYYSDVCNMVGGAGRGRNTSCTALYSRYDALALARCVGSHRAARMIAADNTMHMFVTGPQHTALNK